MKVQVKHGKVTQNMRGASRNYRYVWDVSRVGAAGAGGQLSSSLAEEEAGWDAPAKEAEE